MRSGQSGWNGDSVAQGAEQSRRLVLITLDLKNLHAGRQHAFHIHQFAKCEAPSFESAGPHFNPDS